MLPSLQQPESTVSVHVVYLPVLARAPPSAPRLPSQCPVVQSWLGDKDSLTQLHIATVCHSVVKTTHTMLEPHGAGL